MNRQQLVLNYLPLAHKIAHKKSLNTPKNITLEELKSAAYMGLVDAASRFCFKKGSSFGCYARLRIVGEIQDYLKSCARSNRIRLQEDELEISYSQDYLFDKDFFDFICSFLSEEEGKIIRMYYVEGRALKEIGKQRGVSESRISQILSVCLKKLRKLKDIK